LFISCRTISETPYPTTAVPAKYVHLRDHYIGCLASGSGRGTMITLGPPTHFFFVSFNEQTKKDKRSLLVTYN
jgi:hypothetical protein